MSNFQTQSAFASLKETCAREGLLKASRRRVFSEVALVALLFAASVLLRESFPLIALTLASIGGITLVWWIHDAGHDAYFENRKTAKGWIEFLGILFLGMPQIEYHYEIHRRHHGATNVIGKDGALETGPIIWHPKMLSEKRKQPLIVQNIVWFLFVLPLTWPLITLRCVQTLIARKAYVRLFAFAARWVIAPILVDFDWLFLSVPILVTGFVLGFAATLNHFHMPMGTKQLASFPASVFLTTQNLSQRDWFTTWITGGLNFHIEHHLFPTMPSRHLRRIEPLVEEFARQNGLPYHICDTPTAIRKVWDVLKHPLTPDREHAIVDSPIQHIEGGVQA